MAVAKDKVSVYEALHRYVWTMHSIELECMLKNTSHFLNEVENVYFYTNIAGKLLKTCESLAPTFSDYYLYRLRGNFSKMNVQNGPAHI